MTDIADLDLRIAELERVLDAAVRAATPPITIGELTDVPTPGSPIAAQWAQEVTHRSVMRFPTKAALDGWTTAQNGALAIVNSGATGAVRYQRIAGVWVQLDPDLGQLPNQSGGAGWNLTDMCTVWNFSLPAVPFPRILRVDYVLYVSPGAGQTWRSDLTINGANRQYTIHQGDSSGGGTARAVIAANVAPVVRVDITASSTSTQISLDGQTNQLYWRLDPLWTASAWTPQLPLGVSPR